MPWERVLDRACHDDQWTTVRHEEQVTQTQCALGDDENAWGVVRMPTDGVSEALVYSHRQR